MPAFFSEPIVFFGEALTHLAVRESVRPACGLLDMGSFRCSSLTSESSWDSVVSGGPSADDGFALPAFGVVLGFSGVFAN